MQETIKIYSTQGISSYLLYHHIKIHLCENETLVPKFLQIHKFKASQMGNLKYLKYKNIKFIKSYKK